MNVQFGLSEWREALDFLMEIWPILLPILLLNLTLLIVALINFVRKDLPLGEKVLWLLPILFLQFFGPILYLILGSKYLDNKIENREGDNR